MLRKSHWLAGAALAILLVAPNAHAEDTLPTNNTTIVNGTGYNIGNKTDFVDTIPEETGTPDTTGFSGRHVLDKDIDVLETIEIDVRVDADAAVNVEADKFAESTAVAVQTNTNNEACDNCAEKQDLITGSANDNIGILSVNQSGGNGNNQGTLVSVAVDVPEFDIPPPPPPGGTPDPDPITGAGFAEAHAGADQRNGTASATSNTGAGNTVDTVNVLFRNAIITDSLNGNTGLTYANQATGNFANQVNILSSAISLADFGVALAEADLGQFNADNSISESDASIDTGDPIGVTKLASLSGSLNNNTGVFGVNQSAGNASNQANVVALAAVGGGLSAFAPFTP